jgi:[ribosomal protein S5]-alanine N-acetyltransferase
MSADASGQAVDAAGEPTLPPLDTPRLLLRAALLSDAPFFVRLLNEPSWLQYIGDRGVRTTGDAQHYIRNTIWPSYRSRGYGMYVLQLRAVPVTIGLCGLVQRDFLPAPDLGFALLPDHVGQGFAREAVERLLRRLAQQRYDAPLFAITRTDNVRSVRLLERLGFHRQGHCRNAAGEELEVYVIPALPPEGDPT